MKILIVRLFPDELNINNYNVQEIGLAKALVKKGHICDIVLYTNKKENYIQEVEIDKKNKIKIYWLKGKKFLGNAFFDKELKNIINNYDIIQSGGYDQIYNVVFNRKLNKQLVIYHGNYYSKYSKGYKKKCLISDIFYTFCRNYKKAHFITKSKISTDFLNKKGYKNVETLGVGLDVDRFSKTVAINKEIEKLKNNKGENNYLLYIGKIEERRNILFLLELLNSILKEETNYKLILVGKGNKEYVNKCNNYINENKLQNNIIWIDSLKQDEIPQLYSISDMFLLPTQHEIFGMVLLESMYFGLPVLTTYNGGSSVLIDNGKNGFIEDVDINKWKNIILENINNKEISITAKTTIENKYTWDQLSEKFVEAYEKVIKDYNSKL